MKADRTFAELLDQAIRERGWSLSRTAVAVGVLSDGRALDSTAVKRLREGGSIRATPEVVSRLIEVFDLPRLEAWSAAYPEVVAAVLEVVAAEGGPGQPGASIRWRTRQAA